MSDIAFNLPTDLKLPTPSEVKAMSDKPQDTDLRTAQAAEKPCQLHKYHAPAPARTQGHHRHPVYLQNRVYGQIQDPELLWVCGTCHDSIHSWLGYLLGETRKPNPEPGRLAKAEAKYSFDWYRSQTDTSD